MSDDDDDFLNVDEEGDEMIIGDDDDDNSLYPTSTPSDDISSNEHMIQAKFNSFLVPQVIQLNELVSALNVSHHETTVDFSIPSSYLPSSLQMVCGFYLSPILINVSLVFKTPNWKYPLLTFSATHPIFNQNYVGRPLIYETIRHFFSFSYSPKSSYQSTILNATQFMRYKYDDNQLLFLVYELVDTFYDIQDHCCICRTPFSFSVIKPTICSKKICEVGFNEIGVGSSVAQEIRRDVYSADLLLSLFACSFHNAKYTNPAPPEEIMQAAGRLFDRLPPMRTIANVCQNDSDIIRNYGNETLNLLRWVILSNKSQLICLPDELKLSMISYRKQFMTLMAAPQAEGAFQSKKNKNNSKSLFMWHGSSGDRWHSIIRNGLMNMSKRDCVHGAAYGPGIYLASDYSTSLGYAQPVRNLYKNSCLGHNLSCLALCEVLPVKSFKNFGNIATLQDEGALIVRFIFPIGSNDGCGCSADSIFEDNIPKLDDVLRCLGSVGKEDPRDKRNYNYDDDERNETGKGRRKKHRRK